MEYHIVVILLSLAVVIVTFVLLSLREHNYVNVLFPFILVNVPAYYLLEIIFLSAFKTGASLHAYEICYGMYAIGVVAIAVGYIAVPARWLPIFIALPKVRIPGVHWFLLAAAFTLYAPVLVKYADLISNPREIYTLTRTGYGIQFFISTFLAYLAFIAFLFLRPRINLRSCVFVGITVLLIYLHGSKGELLALGLIGLYYHIFVSGRRLRLGSLLRLGAAAGCTMILLFYVTLPSAMKEDLILGISSYSDYTRHAALVIDDPDLEPQFGRLTFESSVLAVVPRAIFPDKPRDFGSFWLAKRYFPNWFEAATGAPAFGVGLQYADFGPFSLAWEAATHLLLGAFLGILIARLRFGADGGTFLLFLAMMEVPLVPTGSGFPLLLYYVVAHIFGMICVPPRSRSASLRVNQTSVHEVPVSGNR